MKNYLKAYVVISFVAIALLLAGMVYTAITLHKVNQGISDIKKGGLSDQDIAKTVVNYLENNTSRFGPTTCSKNSYQSPQTSTPGILPLPSC